MPPAAEPVRIIQVGAGAMGRAWLQVIADSDRAELVGLVDLNTDAARQAADATGFAGVAVAGSLEELFDQVDAQAVLNVTIPAAHASVSNTALRHGLPVLCEKPLAETVSTGPVDDRRRRAERAAADGVAVAPLLAQPVGVPAADRPARADRHASTAPSSRRRTSVGSARRCRSRC